MVFQFTWYSILTIITAFLCMGLGAIIWSRRPGTGIGSYIVLMIALTEWSLLSGLETGVTNLDLKIAASTLAYLGITIVPAAWLYFVLEYTGRSRWLSRRNILLLAIEPLLVLFAVSSNPFHQQFYSSITLYQDAGYIYAQYEHGNIFWLHVLYSYGMLLLSTSLLIKTFLQSSALYRRQISMMLIAQIAPWIANILYVLGISPLPSYIDLTPIAFAITGLIGGVSLYRYKLLDIVPVARDMVFDSIGDVVIILDLKQRIVDMNQAGLRLLGLTTQDVIGKPAKEVFSQQASLFDEYRNISRIDTELQIEVQDKLQYFNMSISPVQNKQGDAIARIVILHNISEQKLAAQALVEARDEALAAKRIADENSKLKSEFLSTMSHELRTPLNAIEGYTSIMLGGIGVQLEGRVLNMVERISVNSKRLINLINDILDLSRIEAGRMQIINQPILTHDLIATWVKSVGVLAEQKGIEFQVQIHPGMPELLYSDEDALSKIAINLLGNAFKFTDNGRVILNIDRTEYHWKIAVEDTGIGIPHNAQEYIFDEFRQVDGSSQRQHGGTGLGLALVRKLTQALGGQIAVRSEPGQGSTFTVLLPLVPVATVEEGATHAEYTT